MKVCHIIVAAGSGSRYGGDVPKQFLPLQGRPVVMHAVERLRRFGGEDASMLLVLGAAMRPLWRELCAREGFESPEVVDGGATRWESVASALRHPFAAGADVITVHDGARPLVSPGVLARVIDLGDAHGNIPAVALTDSIRIVDPGPGAGGSQAVDRSRYRAVQTPQAFSGPLLRRAYELPYNEAFTDDASVMEAAGFTRLRLVEGDPCNIKITRPGDIEIAGIYLNAMSR